MASEHKFQVNLRGVISLLSDHLYSGPQVYLRELLQNSVDAITARRHQEPDHEGRIQLELLPAKEDGCPTLSVHDNGIGLTEDEVHTFLATIGQSSKRESANRTDFIGQFGIGLLSAFVVSEEVVVITKSLKGGSKPVEWKGRSDGTYSLRTLELEMEVGTQVYLRARPDSVRHFEAKYITGTASHFGGFLPFTMDFVSGDETQRLNQVPPWSASHRSLQAKQRHLMEYGKDVFGIEFLDAIPLYSEVGGVEGVAYVLPVAVTPNSKKSHRVYLKNMLLSEEVENLLPSWAFFVKCIVNATNLRPTAAREAFYEDERLAATQMEIGESLKNYLLGLMQTNRDRLNAILDCHYLAIKSLATTDPEFFQLFGDWLPFETTLGDMTLGEIREGQKHIRFVATRDQFRQITGVAAAQGICILNAGYTYDKELLAMVPEVFPEYTIECVDANDLSHNFAELAPQEEASVENLIKAASQALAPFKCEAVVRKFAPNHLPTLYTASDQHNFSRDIDHAQEVSDDLWSGILENVSDAVIGSTRSQLCLNFTNPLVKRLAKLQSLPLIQQVIEVLYVQSLLLGHFPLKAQETQLLSEGLLGLIELSLQGTEE